MAAATIVSPPRAVAQWITDGEPVAPPRTAQVQPRIALDGTGGAIMVWQDVHTCRGDADIFAQRFDAAGNPLWGTDGVPVCTVIDAQSQPQIVTDLAGGAIIFWHDYRSGANLDIYAQRISPTGATLWAPGGIPICNVLGNQSFVQHFTHAAVSDGAGGALVVWSDTRSGGPNFYIQHVTSSGSSVYAANGIPVAALPATQLNPAICNDNAGGAIVTWIDDRSGDWNLYAQRISAVGVTMWPAGGVSVCSAPNVQDFATIVADGAGGAIISWQDARNPANVDAYVQRLKSTGGNVWPLDGLDISPVPGTQYSPQVVSDGAGGAVVAWTDAGDIRAQRVDSQGAFLWPYLAGLPVSVAPTTEWIQQIAPDGAGGAMITWQDTGIDGLYDLYAQRVTAAGALAWGGSVPICRAIGLQEYDEVIPDLTGGGIVVWQDRRSGPFAPSFVGYDIYAHRVDGAGTLLWNPNGTVVAAPAVPQSAPAIAPDGLGGAVVAWEDHRDACDGDIYVQRLDASGGRHAGLDGRLVCGAVGSQQGPQVCSDGAGGGIVVWTDERSGNADIYAQRVNDTGVSLWPPSHGIPVCIDPDPQSHAVIVACESGGAIIVWYDQRGGGDQIFAQKVTSAGAIAPGWPVNGLAVITGIVSQQFSPQVASDGADGCIVAWEDMRSGKADIYVQRIDQLGVRQWLASGQPVCTAVGDQLDPRLVIDGAKGAIVTWEDYRAGNIDIYAQRVKAGGAPSWPVDGIPVDADADIQKQPVLAADGSGGAILAWRDEGGIAFHVDAQRLNSSGTLLWAPSGVPVCIGPGPQEDPVITADGAGGAVVAWHDAGGGSGDIHAQRLDASGAAHCGSCGVTVCAAPENQYAAVIAPDGVGGAIMAWTDPRSVHVGDQEIYAMRLAPECGAYATGVESEPAPAPKERPIQNRPNPFNPETVISYELAKAGHVRIDLFDASGRRVRTLVDASQEVGHQETRWNGELASGQPAPSGAYFYKVTFPDGVTASKKMVLLR